MGTWGHDFDENDDAADFLGQANDTRDWSLIDTQIRTFIAAGGYEDAQQTVAALELVATAFGKAPEEIQPDIKAWASEHATEAQNIRTEALQAIDLVISTSELSKLWAETGVDPESALGWRAAVADLKLRLQE